MNVKLNGEFIHSFLRSHSLYVQDIVGKKKDATKPVSCVSRSTFDKALTTGVPDSTAKLICEQLADFFQRVFRHPPLTYRELIDPAWLEENADEAATLRYLDWKVCSPSSDAPLATDSDQEVIAPAQEVPLISRRHPRRLVAIASLAVLLMIALMTWLALVNGSPSASSTPPDVVFSVSALPSGSEESVPLEFAKMPLKAGDSVQFHARASEPCYLYLFWLDALGKSTPVWPWQDLTWDPGISSEPVNAFRFPEGQTYFELQPDTTGIHAVILFASRKPIKDLEALRNYLESLGYRQTGLTTINSQLLAVIENGVMVRAHDRSPLRDDRKKLATSPTSILQTKLPPPFLPKDIAVTSICFAFEGEARK